MVRKVSLGAILLLTVGFLVNGVAGAQDGSQTATPLPTSTEQPVEATPQTADAAAQAAPEGPFAYLQFAQLSYDAPGLEVNIDGEPSDIQELAFGGISGWIELPPDSYQIALVPVGEGLEQALVGPITYTLAPNVWTTLASVGSTEAGDFTIRVLRTDYSTPGENMARVAFFHALQGAPSVDLALADGTVLAGDVGYVGDATGVNAGLAEFEMNAGTYSLKLTPTGATEPVIATVSDLMLEPQTFYFIAVFGTVDAPVVQVESYSIAELSQMTNATFGAAPQGEQTTGAETETSAEATPVATVTATPAS